MENSFQMLFDIEVYTSPVSLHLELLYYKGAYLTSIIVSAANKKRHTHFACTSRISSCGQQDDKPGYVVNDHLSRPAVANRLKRLTPEQTGRPALLFKPCFGWGLHCPMCYHTGGSLLHCPSNLTRFRRRYISVALSLESPPPAVSRHPALWSPDFPHPV